MWPDALLSTLDTASKGLRDVHVEPRSPADLWIRGSGTLDGPVDEWSFESPSSMAGSSSTSTSMFMARRTDGEVGQDDVDRISYPLRVRFEVALVDAPECGSSGGSIIDIHHHYDHLLITIASMPFCFLWPHSPTHVGRPATPLQDLSTPRL